MALTTQAIDRKTARLESLLARSTRSTLAGLTAKVDDARAHAALVVTPTMRRRQGGRPTLGAIRVHPSYQAAVHRMKEAKDDAAAAVRAAREAMAVEAVLAWADLLPAELIGTGPHQATVALQSQARAMVLYGHTVEYFLAGPFDRAVSRLLPAVEQASRAGASGRDTQRLLADWQRQEIGSIGQALVVLLRTSLTAIDRMAGRWLIPADLLEPDQDAPYGGT